MAGNQRENDSRRQQVVTFVSIDGTHLSWLTSGVLAVMKLPRRLSLALASLLFVVNAGLFAAAPKVEETVLGPANVGGLYTLAPAGAHVAYMGRNGAKFFIKVDGEDGPQFDEIVKAAGGGAFYPEKAGVWPGTLGGLEGHDAPVLYSRDGAHYAYLGRQDKDYVVIYDGKELARGPWELSGRRGLTMSPGGKYVYWVEAKMEQGRTIARTVVNGKPGPWTFGSVTVVFSPDDSRYAYVIPQTKDTGKPVLIVDDKDAGYVGQSPTFTADGRTLLTINYDSGQGVILANGKPTYSATAGVDKIVVAPAGKRWAAIVGKLGANNRGIKVLVVDGKEVNDSQDVEEVWFSPDGKRYAARCQNLMTRYFGMLVDGKLSTFARVDAQPPYWTPDGSKVIYSGGAGSENVVVVNDDVYAYTGALSTVIVAAKGGNHAWLTADNGRRDYSVVVGDKNVLPRGVYPMSEFTFSPDGSRYGYLVGPVGRGEVTGIVIDGVIQPGLAPGVMAKWINRDQPPSFAFSPDSQHVAYVARAGSKPTNDLYMDGKVIATTPRAVYFPEFTPDGKHFYWLAEELPHPTTALYVDGQLAVRANGYFFQQLPGSIDMASDGTVTFLAADGDTVKRYRVTPPADTSVATLLEKGTAVAVAAAPSAPPKPVTSSPASTAAAKPPPAPAATPKTATTATAAAPAQPAAGGPVTPLTWNDLVRRPEARPTTCTVNREYKFQNGATVRAGTKVNVFEVTPASAGVGTPDGRINFAVKPEESDILAVANAAWSQLTPAQRELTYPALLRRQDLWPYQVKLSVPLDLGSDRLNVGDSVILRGLEGNELLVYFARANTSFTVDPQQTDLMQQARGFVASPDGAPGRILTELSGKLIDPTSGQQVSLDASLRPKYVVLYRGAAWCGPCQIFAPKLVQALNEKSPKPEDVTLIYVSADKTPAEMKGYVTKLGIGWPTIRYNNTAQLPAFYSLFGDTIPHLVVTDRSGKVVIDSAKVGQDRALAQLRGLL